tara:strand:+ start:121 stop:363 length:243 start_codon:yes stop_codon:yes gene_type:complete
VQVQLGMPLQGKKVNTAGITPRTILEGVMTQLLDLWKKVLYLNHSLVDKGDAEEGNNNCCLLNNHQALHLHGLFVDQQWM